MLYNLQYVEYAYRHICVNYNGRRCFCEYGFSPYNYPLRKERNISQKQAATDLGVSQALLSHYEKGIRECGLDFLVKTADYYNVSCDYLLGRCAEPMGKAAKEAPAASGEDKDKLTEEQKMLLDSQKLIFSMVSEKDEGKLEKAVRSYLSLAVYRIFRVIFSANPKNDRRFFTLSSPAADGFTLSAMELKKPVPKPLP